MSSLGDVLIPAITFLDYLEQTRENGGSLPFPYVMLRIQRLLTELQPKSLRNEEDTAADERAPIRPKGDTSARNRPQVVDPVDNFKNAIDEITASERPVFVDVQMLSSDQGLVIKEFAASCRGCPSAWVIVRPPEASDQCSLKNEYVIEKVHGIPWNSGVLEERELWDITRRMFDGTRKIYTKGLEKKNVLEKRLCLHPATVEDLRVDSKLVDLVERHSPQPCPLYTHADNVYKCALKNSLAVLAEYYEQRYEKGAVS